MSVTTIADARAGLSGLIAAFRADPGSPPVTIGSHRKPEAVLLSAAAYTALVEEPVLGLARLRALAPVIRRLARAAHLDDPSVYGSVARGEQGPDSDVDLLVNPGPDATLFDIAQFEMDLELLLDAPVSVVARTSLDPVRDAHIVAEAVPL